MAHFPRKKKKDDGRTHYRVRTQEGLAVQVQIGESFPEVQLLDISSGGTGLFVLEADVAGFEEGKTLDLVFTPETGSRGIHVRARIQQVEPLETQLGTGARIGMQFTDQETLFEQLDAGLWGFFNRRAAYRVTQPEKETELKLKFRSSALDAWLVDISTRGFACKIDRGTSLLLLPGHPAQAKFQIPGTQNASEFHATTVYRCASPNTIRIGFLFDQEATEDFTRHEDLISDYVMEQQRQELQELQRD